MSPRSALRLLALALLPWAASCASGPVFGGDDDAIVGKWTVTSIGDEPVPDGAEIFLQFGADGGFSGHAGVNRFSGAWSGEPDALQLSPLAVTRMAGPPERMEREQLLLAALGQAVRARRDGSLLTLTDGAGQGLVRASRPEVSWQRLTGSAEFAVPAELEPGHELEVSIRAEDGSLDGGVDIAGTGQSSIPFQYRYRSDAIDPSGSYTLTARVVDPTGAVVWQTERAIPVLSEGAPKSGVRVVLVRVE